MILSFVNQTICINLNTINDHIILINTRIYIILTLFHHCICRVYLIRLQHLLLIDVWCIYVNLDRYMHEYTCICMNKYVSMYVCSYEFMHVCIFACMYVCIPLCNSMYICMYVYIHVCIYVSIYACIFVLQYVCMPV